MKIKELMIYCTNRGCTECQESDRCAAFQDRFDCLPGLNVLDKELYAAKIDIIADHGNEEI